MKLFVLGSILIAVAGLAYVRLAPSDPSLWHVALDFRPEDKAPKGAYRVVDGDMAAFAALHARVLAAPRTRQIAGDPAQGHVTYLSRTKWIGFPDYTTIQLSDGMIRLWGRQRFGTSDLGVNAARLDAWLGRS